ncbi:MAG TPA: ParB/RepB/Spo0J family partition protein, partial [Brevundimonas sp.]|nr:ParB/RepB/Spo0J family partition protein [Brevundimonas sp.]
MAFDLNPVAVSAAPLLRAIETGGWVTKTELAEMAGRQRSNIARDLSIIENAGLIVQVADADAARPILLTEAGLAQLAAITRAEDPDAATGALTALLTDLEPHPLNPRKDFESDDAEDALNELRESILLRSLMQPIVVRPRPEAGKWWIVDGERRFRAIKQANWDGDWSDDKPVPIVVRDVDDREHLLLSLTANLQRADMSAIEEGHAFHA